MYSGGGTETRGVTRGVIREKVEKVCENPVRAKSGDYSSGSARSIRMRSLGRSILTVPGLLQSRRWS